MNSRDQVIAALEAILDTAKDADLEKFLQAIENYKIRNMRARMSPLVQGIFEAVEDEHGYRHAMAED